MNNFNPAVPLSVRIPPEMRNQLDELADATGRTKSFLAAEAIASYLAVQAWQIKATQEAVKKADSENAKFIEHAKVSEWIESWDSENEQDMPE